MIVREVSVGIIKRKGVKVAADHLETSPCILDLFVQGSRKRIDFVIGYELRLLDVCRAQPALPQSFDNSAMEFRFIRGRRIDADEGSARISQKGRGAVRLHGHQSGPKHGFRHSLTP